ncbi:hypothetical protein SLA2020_395420 [Shorea laevis]
MRENLEAQFRLLHIWHKKPNNPVVINCGFYPHVTLMCLQIVPRLSSGQVRPPLPKNSCCCCSKFQGQLIPCRSMLAMKAAMPEPLWAANC